MVHDVHKGEWRTISTDDFVRYLYTFWYNNHVLYGLSFGNGEYSQFELNKLDLRDNQRKWIKSWIDFDGMENGKSYSFFS